MTTYAQKQLEEQGQNTFHLFKQYLDDKLGEVRTEVGNLKTSSTLSGEDKQTIERLQTMLAEQKGQLDALQVALRAPAINEAEQKASSALERKTAFNKMLRYGTTAVLSESERKHIKWSNEMPGLETEQKALYAADATTGGFLTTPEYVDELLKNIVLLSPMAEIVDMRTTNKPFVMTPRRTQTASAVRVAEQATRTETQNPRFGLMQNFPYESYAFTLVSRTDLEDSELDIASFLMAEFAEQFAVLQGKEYISGLGSSSSQSFGFLQDAIINNGGNGHVTTGTSGQFDYQSLVTLKGKLKPGYLPNATWIWTNETMTGIQALTDGQGRPLWVPFGGTLPDTIFGRPYRIMPDMPQTVGNGGSAGALAIAFGDFKSGYQGVVRKQVSMQVLNERYADQNAVGYFGYYRFGGTTKISEAIKTLRVKP